MEEALKGEKERGKEPKKNRGDHQKQREGKRGKFRPGEERGKRVIREGGVYSDCSVRGSKKDMQMVGPSEQ